MDKKNPILEEVKKKKTKSKGKVKNFFGRKMPKQIKL